MGRDVLTTNEQNSGTKATERSGQFKLLLLILIASAPVVVAAYMYFGKVGIPATTTNKGNIIAPPVAFENLGIGDLIAEEPAFKQIEGQNKWVILLVANKDCDQQCERSLYNSRQVHTALGKDANRVGRLLLVTEQSSRLQSVLAEHPGLVHRQITAQEADNIVAVAAERGVVLNSYDLLIVDPLGNIMMHYKSQQDGRDLLDDLKRLLRVSKIG